MSNLVNLHTCSSKVSPDAEKCPHCGEPNFKTIIYEYRWNGAAKKMEIANKYKPSELSQKKRRELEDSNEVERAKVPSLEKEI